MRRPSLKIRITAWFALMMFVIEALVLSFLLAVNGTIVTNDPESRLVRMVEHNANRVKYKNRQFRYDHIHYYRSGVYTVLYDADGNPLQGTFPAEFSPAQPLPLSGDAVRTVTCGDVTLPFEVGDYVRWRLMNGYDDIDLTLQHEDDIIAYEKMRAEKFPFKPKTLPVKREPEQPIESAREGEYPDWQGPLADRGII